MVRILTQFLGAKNLCALAITLLSCLLMLSCTDGKRRQMARIIIEADSMNRNYVPMTSDSLLTLACRFYDRHGTPNERMKAHYLLGCAYRDMGEAPHALDCYHQAVACADTTTKDCDYHTLVTVYGQMAWLFQTQFLPDDEIAALKMVAQMARMDCDTLTEIIATHRLTSPYFMKCDTDSVLIVEKQVRELYLQHGYKDYAGQAVLGSISIALDRHHLQEADRLLSIYRNESGLFDDEGEAVRGGSYYIDKGIYMTKVGNLDSALYFYRKAIECEQYEGAYKGLLSVYEKQNRPDSIAKYARLLADANDSSYLHVNQEAVHRISALYNYSRQQKIAEGQADKARKANMMKTILLGIIVVIVFVFFFAYIRTRQRAKEKVLNLLNAYNKSQTELTAAIDRQRLLRYDYEVALQGKDEEHHQLLCQIQEDINQKEGEIDVLKKKVKCLEEQLRQLSSSDLENEFKKSNIFKLFNERRKSKYVLEPPSEENWHELIELFRTHYVRFNTFITSNRRLSTNQYRYCVLLRMGFDNTDICILMGKDKDQRYHLRKLICETLFGKSVNVKVLEDLLKEHF